MARRQDPAGRRGARPLKLASAELAAFAGVGYLRRAEAGFDGVDCGDSAGLVLGALREGWQTVGYSGKTKTAKKLAEIAKARGARLIAGKTGR